MSIENPKFSDDQYPLAPRGADADVVPDEPSVEPLPKPIQCDERVVYEGVRSALANYTPDTTDRSNRDQYYDRDRYLGEVGYLLHDGNTPPEDFFQAVNGGSTPVE